MAELTKITPVEVRERKSNNQQTGESYTWYLVDAGDRELACSKPDVIEAIRRAITAKQEMSVLIAPNDRYPGTFRIVGLPGAPRTGGMGRGTYQPRYADLPETYERKEQMICHMNALNNAVAALGPGLSPEKYAEWAQRFADMVYRPALKGPTPTPTPTPPPRENMTLHERFTDIERMYFEALCSELGVRPETIAKQLQRTNVEPLYAINALRDAIHQRAELNREPNP